MAPRAKGGNILRREIRVGRDGLHAMGRAVAKVARRRAGLPFPGRRPVGCPEVVRRYAGMAPGADLRRIRRLERGAVRKRDSMARAVAGVTPRRTGDRKPVRARGQRLLRLAVARSTTARSDAAFMRLRGVGVAVETIQRGVGRGGKAGRRRRRTFAGRFVTHFTFTQIDCICGGDDDSRRDNRRPKRTT